MSAATMGVRESIAYLLSDGMPHKRDEIHALCGPSSKTVIQQHIACIRKELRPRGEDIICEYRDRTFQYRHVRLLRSPNKD